MSAVDREFYLVLTLLIQVMAFPPRCIYLGIFSLIGKLADHDHIFGGLAGLLHGTHGGAAGKFVENRFQVVKSGYVGSEKADFEVE